MRRVPSAVQLLLAAVLLLPILGCAFGDRSIALQYKPVGALEATAAKDVSVARFDDRRDDISQVGEVRNGLGWKTAKVVLAKGQDPGGWVANAISAELEKAGLSVTKVATYNEATDGVVIHGSITHLYTKMYLSYRANVQLNIVVQRSGIPVLTKDYTGRGSGLAIFVTPNEYEAATRAALQNALKQALPEIIEALS